MALAVAVTCSKLLSSPIGEITLVLLAAIGLGTAGSLTLVFLSLTGGARGGTD